MHKLAIKGEGIDKKRRNAPVLHLAAGFIMIAKTLDYIHKFRFENTVTAIPFFIVGAISLFYGFKMKKLDTVGKYNPWLRLLQTGFFAILGTLFLSLDGVVDEIIVFVYGAICAYLFFVEKRIFQDQFIQLNKEGIILPGDHSDLHLEWSKVIDVVARPDYITIFKEKNNYLQLELLHSEEAQTLESINAFARQQIKQNK